MKRYTNEQDQWLRENAIKHTYKELVELFNEKFHEEKNYYTLKTHCVSVLKISANAKSKGCRNYRNLPIGSERIGRDGRIWVKVSDIPTSRTTKNHSLNWESKGRLVWEKHFGEIPKGHNIVYLDGNPLNCDISNLECTSSKIQGKVCMLYNDCSQKLKKCAIKMYALEKILIERGGQEDDQR